MKKETRGRSKRRFVIRRLFIPNQRRTVEARPKSPKSVPRRRDAGLANEYMSFAGADGK